MIGNEQRQLRARFHRSRNARVRWYISSS